MVVTLTDVKTLTDVQALVRHLLVYNKMVVVQGKKDTITAVRRVAKLVMGLCKQEFDEFSAQHSRQPRFDQPQAA